MRPFLLLVAAGALVGCRTHSKPPGEDFAMPFTVATNQVAAPAGPELANGTEALVSSELRPVLHSFAIYIVTSAPERSTFTNGSRGDLSKLRLASSPLISEADVIAYDWSNHSITVTSDALSRLPQPSLQGTPFVVVADRQRIYEGVFTTPISSFGQMGRPSIMVWQHSREPYPLEIEFLPSPGKLFLPFNPPPDPRPDPRIRQALAALQKLK